MKRITTNKEVSWGSAPFRLTIDLARATTDLSPLSFPLSPINSESSIILESVQNFVQIKPNANCLFRSLIFDVLVYVPS